MNSFNTTIQHNLNIGLQNAANAIKMGCYEQALELLSGTQEMLSLIEPEGEQWIDINDRMPEDYSYVLAYVPTRQMPFMAIWCNRGLGYKWESEFVEINEGISHWQYLPVKPPLTLQEAVVNNFQQSIEIPPINLSKEVGEAALTNNIPEHFNK